MALAYEGNTSLAFDTTVLRESGKKYCEIAKSLRTMCEDLDACLEELEQNGWKTPAGSAFHKMTQVDWKDNIEKYADLLETLNSIMIFAAARYDTLTTQHIEKTYL